MKIEADTIPVISVLFNTASPALYYNLISVCIVDALCLNHGGNKLHSIFTDIIIMVTTSVSNRKHCPV